MTSDPDDNWRVVDGLQRLGAMRSFILEKHLRLRGMEYFNQFEGCGYDQLPRLMQRRITETKLTCQVIEAGPPPDVMWNLVNSLTAVREAVLGSSKGVSPRETSLLRKVVDQPANLLVKPRHRFSQAAQQGCHDGAMVR